MGHGESGSKELYVNGWRVVPERNLIFGMNGPIRVEPKIMAVLLCLASRPGSLVSHAELIRSVWGPEGATLDLASRAIGRLRQALAQGDLTSSPIETVRGGGYCLVADVCDSVRPGLAARGYSTRDTSFTPGTASALSFAASALVWLIACQVGGFIQ